MKKIKLFIISIFIGYNSFAQGTSKPLNNYLLDFAVPDMPAFKALDANPSDILRPNDTKKFAIMLTPFYSSQNVVFPKNFALEFAPFKYASNWTLREYDKTFKRILYNSSISIGTIKDTTLYANKLSVGLRTGYVWKDHLKNLRNTEKIYEYLEFQRNYMIQFDKIKNYWLVNIVKQGPEYFNSDTANQIKFFAWINDMKNSDKKAILNDTINVNPRQLLMILIDNKIKTNPEFIALITKRLDTKESELNTKYNIEKSNWNETRTDIALAYVAESKDSLVGNAQFSSARIWLTQAIGIKTKQQLLIGFNFSNNKILDTVRNVFSANLRYYYGDTTLKGFCEIQYKQIDFLSTLERNAGFISNKNLLINIGIEYKISNSMWLVASAGVSNPLHKNTEINKNILGPLVASFDLRYAFNK